MKDDKIDKYNLWIRRMIVDEVEVICRKDCFIRGFIYKIILLFYFNNISVRCVIIIV